MSKSLQITNADFSKIAKKFDLDDRQARFVERYVVDFNGTKAALAAGYSKKNPEAVASRVLRGIKVRSAIEHLLNKQSKNIKINAEQLLREMTNLGFSDLGDFVKWDKDGELSFIPSDKIPAEKRRCIQEITQTTLPSGAVKLTIKLHPKTQHIKMLAQHLQLIKTGASAPKSENEVTDWARFLLKVREKMNTKDVN